ncbi:hypothetical protein I5M32_03805 [Pedobacter sp. SD-b]|uniref:Capsule polysaccharide biosynthesis protein n=2 Tax=Pedobacter segetis TaxID=2793069 RepID=A0ABS1BGV6_9SPHI|nr:hypothetical protein [Pedobacter segetis]
MRIKDRKDTIFFLNNLFKEKYNDLQKVWGFNPWIVLKIQTGYFINTHLLGIRKKSTSSIENNSYKPNSVTLKDFINLVKIYIKILPLRFRSSRKEKHALLIGYAHHNKIINNESYNIYLHPILDYLKKNNIKHDFLYIDKIKDFNSSHEDYKLLDLLINFYRLWFRIKCYFNHEDRKAYKNAEIVVDFTSKTTIYEANTLKNILFETQLQQAIIYASYKSFLKIIKPKFIWTYCYYDNIILALSRAAKKLNIVLVEYQHSTQSDNHFAYSKWEKISKPYFPSYFWVWSATEEKSLNKNFLELKSKPKIIVGGNLFLSIQVKSAEIKKKNDGILVCLQGIWIPSFIEKFIENDKTYKWYFRLHPRYPKDDDKLKMLKKKFPHRIEVEKANVANLYEVFSEVNYNLTSFSGTALESQAFGIQNIIFGDEGYEAYKLYIEEGAFKYVNSTEGLEKVLTSPFHLKVFDPILVDTANIERKIKEILN